MDTMIYAAIAAFRGDVAEKNNQPVLREAEFTAFELAQIGQARQLFKPARRAPTLSRLTELAQGHPGTQSEGVGSDGHYD